MFDSLTLVQRIVEIAVMISSDPTLTAVGIWRFIVYCIPDQSMVVPPTASLPNVSKERKCCRCLLPLDPMPMQMSRVLC